MKCGVWKMYSRALTAWLLTRGAGAIVCVRLKILIFFAHTDKHNKPFQSVKGILLFLWTHLLDTFWFHIFIESTLNSQNEIQHKVPRLLFIKPLEGKIDSNTECVLTNTIWPACHIISNFCFSVYSANLNLNHSFPLVDQYCSTAWQIMRDFNCLYS